MIPPGEQFNNPHFNLFEVYNLRNYLLSFGKQTLFLEIRSQIWSYCTKTTKRYRNTQKTRVFEYKFA